MRSTFDHSKGRFRVSYQDHGDQRRKFFRTEAEADEFLKSRKKDVREFGIHWHNTWTPRERAEIFLETERLRQAGWTLRAAVDFVLSHGTNPPAVLLETVARDFLNAKQPAGCRPRHLARLRASVGRFLTGRGDKPVAEITPAEKHRNENETATRKRNRAAAGELAADDLRALPRSCPAR